MKSNLPNRNVCRHASLKRCAQLCLLIGLLAALPQPAHAHGDLLIRIAAITRQIDSATDKSATLYLQRGELYRQDLNWTAAEADYTRAKALDPALPRVDLCHARMLADSGKLEAARCRLDTLLKQEPRDGEAFIARARVLIKMAQQNPAITDYRRGLDLLLEPAPEYFVELAQALEADHHQADALQALDTGIKKLGPILTLQIPALELEVKLSHHEAALVRIDSILQRVQRKEAWLARRGDVLLAAGRKEEARKAYEDALKTIKALPTLVQQGPSMRTLASRLTTALTGMTSASMAAN